MTSVVAVLSFLHQVPRGTSADRLFRGQSVLDWTLRRLWRSRHLAGVALVCWDDQTESLQPFAGANRATVVSRGPRTSLPRLNSIAAARRWADGWRGGLLGACSFDLGFDPGAVKHATTLLGGDATLLIDPDSALVDPALLDALVTHADEHATIEYAFQPAAPGLSGLLLRPPMLDRLAASQLHLGKYLNYYPDLPGKDPIGKDECAPVPIPVARTFQRFNLDSPRQIQRLTRAVEDLNGELLRADAEELVHRMNRAAHTVEEGPREVELEINTARATRPIYWPGRHLSISRPDLTLENARRLFDQIGADGDTRLTLAGVGDPLLHPRFFEILSAARNAGVRAIHIETDLLPSDPSMLKMLAESEVDVVSIHLPATSVGTYAQFMGVDALAAVMENLSALLRHRTEIGRGTPIVVPTFVKCRENLHEMEAWYDHWLIALGSATITGPSDFGGTIPDAGVADMAPSKRRPCRRLSSRLTVLSDGAVVPCSQDVAGKQVMGRLATDRIGEMWRGACHELRQAHAREEWGTLPTCAGCREWHRP